MTIRYLLDTNILSEAIKSYPDERTLERLSEHDGELATCSVVWHELSFGAARLTASKKRLEETPRDRSLPRRGR